MNLSYSIYLVEICPLEDLMLPKFIGSALRGAFGHAFKSITCKRAHGSCLDCSVKLSCTYKRIFDVEVKKSDAKFISGFEQPPRPFVIRPALNKKISFGRNEPIKFELVLIGYAQDFISSFAEAIQKMCKGGLGAKKIKCELKSVSLLRQLSIGENFPLNRAKIKFLSPFRFKRAGRFSVELDFPKFATQLLKRIFLLDHLYSRGETLSKPKLADLLKIAKDIKTVESNLKWLELKRYSNRQRAEQKLGGVIGHITFEGDLTPFSAYLKAGEELHVGKQTTFGLGQYKICN